MARLVHLLPPLLIGLIAVLFIVQAQGFKSASGTVPIGIGWTVLMLAAIDLATRVGGAVGLFMDRMFKPTQGLGPPLVEVSVNLQAAAIGSLVALVGAFILLGVLPACGIFVVLAIRFGAQTRWLTALLSGLGIVLVVWAAFGALLGLDLPVGYLFVGES